MMTILQYLKYILLLVFLRPYEPFRNDYHFLMISANITDRCKPGFSNLKLINKNIVDIKETENVGNLYIDNTSVLCWRDSLLPN